MAGLWSQLIGQAILFNEGVARATGISPVDLQTFGIIARHHGPMTATQVATSSGLPASTTTRVLDRLERRSRAVRKRHLATDALGLLLVVIVTAASVSDTAAGRDVIDRLAATHPQVVTAWVDAGYRNTVIERGAAHGIDVQVVSKAPGHKGFQPLPKRWAIGQNHGRRVGRVSHR